MNARVIPLRGQEGTSFSYVTVDPIPERLHQIDMAAGGRIGFPAQPITNPETRDQYYVSSLIEEATTSSLLEGAATTKQVAREMITTGRRPRTHGERMIGNNYRAMRRIGELKNEPLSPELVFELHRIVTLDTLSDNTAAGRLRRTDENIVVEGDAGEVLHTPPPAAELTQRMRALCRFANDESGAFVHPAVRSILLHFWLAYDHPFVDGNGRTARALFYWSMLRRGYWLFEFISISSEILKSPAQYNLAYLHSETDDNDATYFVLYHLEVIHRAQGELHEFIERKTSETQRLVGQLRGLEHLNHRQRGALADAIKHPGQELTIKQHQVINNVVYQTARSDLMRLEEMSLLSSVKRGKKLVFTPARDLRRRLEGLEPGTGQGE